MKMASTQVSTSHTVQRAHHATPLKVIRRPPRNDVTHAIQTFLPYVVAFLLALMVYTSFRSSSTTQYPPYSPPNMLEESIQSSSSDVAGFLNRRMDRLEQIMRKAEASESVQAGHWANWRNQKALELDERKRVAEQQMPNKVVEGVKAKSEDVLNKAADWWSNSNTQDFAYDAMYSWRQKAEQFKNAAAEKIEDIKESGAEAAENVMETIEDSTNALTQAAINMKNKATFNRLMNTSDMSFTDRLSALVNSVKDSITSDTEARQFASLNDVDVSKRADMIIQQLQYLGDDVIEEIFRKLDIERTSQCTCPDNTQTTCPK